MLYVQGNHHEFHKIFAAPRRGTRTLQDNSIATGEEPPSTLDKRSRLSLRHQLLQLEQSWHCITYNQKMKPENPQTKYMDEFNQEVEIGLAKLKNLYQSKSNDGRLTTNARSKLNVTLCALNEHLLKPFWESPTEVNGIEIIVASNPKLGDDTSLKDDYLFEPWYRFMQAELMGDERSESVKLVLHPPFDFSTGAHGSGERNRQMASNTNIQFKLCYGYQRKQGHLPVLQVSLGPKILYGNGSNFNIPIQAVNSIRADWVRDDSFTPEFTSSLDREGYDSEPSHNTLAHYLLFSGFAYRLRELDNRIPMVRSERDSLIDICNNTLYPARDTGLLRSEPSTNMVSGFVVFAGGDQIRLYKLDAFEVPDWVANIDTPPSYTGLPIPIPNETANAAYALHAIREGGEDIEGKFKVYEGTRAIIQKLHESGTKDRFAF
jgi:hypothetical protein